MTSEELKVWCQEHSDVVLIIQDSFDCGNCESGTMDFVEEFFPDRQSVTARELVEYIDTYQGIRRLLRYKAMMVAKENADEKKAETE